MLWRFVWHLNRSVRRRAPSALPRSLRLVLCLTLSLFFTQHSNTRRGHASKETTTTHDEPAAAPVELRAGAPVATHIGKDGRDVYRIDLNAGQYLDLSIDKETDLALSITLYKPDGQKLIEHVSRRYGGFHVPLVADATGAYRLEVRSLEQDSTGRLYRLGIEEIRNSVEQDGRNIAAARAMAEAGMLRSEWKAASLRRAIETYAVALALWRARDAGREVDAGREAVEALQGIGEVRFILGEYDSALDVFRKAHASSIAGGYQQGQIEALNNIAYVYISQGHNLKALTYCTRALALAKRERLSFSVQASRRAQAQAINNMGEVYYSLGDPKKAANLFQDALKLWTETADRKGQALAHLNLGYTNYDMGDTQAASEHYHHSLSFWRAMADPRGEALARTALGGVYAFRGERQSALDAHAEAARVFRVIGDRQGEAAALNGVGRIYEELNKPETALDNYRRALQLFHEIGNRNYQALTECYVGRVYGSMGERPQALASYQRSVAMSRSVGDHRIAAYALNGVGQSYGSMGEGQRALARHDEALHLYRKIGDRRGQAQTLGSIALIHRSSGQRQKALGFYKQALSLYQLAGDLGGEAATRYNLAREARDCHLLDESLSHIRESIATVEALRTRISSYELRSSYFAMIHEYYEFYIDLLMQLHEQRPAENFAALALQTSESSRSRSFLELLTEAKADIRQGVSQDLLERERYLQQLLSARAKFQMRLMSNTRTEAQAAEIGQEIRRITTEYEEVQMRIREQSPRYASLTHPQLLHLADIQSKLLDEDTVLLEYALGNERSYLWVVTLTSLESYELPPRSSIEDAAREVYRLLTARQQMAAESFPDYRKRISESDQKYWQQAAVLSRMLLGQAADRIARKRLFIVADGALHHIPFAALPMPGAASSAEEQSSAGGVAGEPAPLVLSNEIVNLPSASTLASLRRDDDRPATARKTIAVLADPVFERDDPRVRDRDGTTEVVREVEAVKRDAYPLLRDFEAWGEGQGIPRLPSTLREARAILKDISRDEVMMATGFDANRVKAMSGELGRYRVLHFATHGIVNSEHPEGSGILLSMVNERGEPENGFLQLHDIYNLKLSADLVVLSACSTGLGKNIKGEGIIGLTRGFMYAGSKSIVASLWKVDDDATAELMKHFYKALLKDGLPPPAALKRAQEAMWRQERWRAPYYWAAFVLEGEYNGTIKAVGARSSPAGRIALPSILVLALSAVGLYAFKRARKRPSRAAAGASSTLGDGIVDAGD